MKTFKELLENSNIKVPMGTELRTAMQYPQRSDFGAHRVEFDEQVMRINSFIENYFARPILDSVGAFTQLRAKLNIVGLDFDFDPSVVAEGGDFALQLTRHGGSFGTTQDHDLKAGFYQGDGIAGKVATLEGTCERTDTGYMIKAGIRVVDDTETEMRDDPDIE